MTNTVNDLRNKKLVQSPDIISSKLGADIVVMNPVSGKYLALNQVAAAIFEMLARPHTPEEVTEHLMQQFDVTPGQCVEESLTCIGDMLDKGLLREA